MLAKNKRFVEALLIPVIFSFVYTHKLPLVFHFALLRFVDLPQFIHVVGILVVVSISLDEWLIL